MVTLEEQIDTPYGAVSVRFQGRCEGLRLVRRVVNQAELDLRNSGPVDHVEVLHAFMDRGAQLQDRVTLALHFDWPASPNGDQGVWSLDFDVGAGLMSLAVLDDQDLERRRGVTLLDPNAEINALLARERLTLAEMVARGLAPPYSPPTSPWTLNVGVSPPGGFLTAAIAWKAQADEAISANMAAEDAAFTLG